MSETKTRRFPIELGSMRAQLEIHRAMLPGERTTPRRVWMVYSRIPNGLEYVRFEEDDYPEGRAEAMAKMLANGPELLELARRVGQRFEGTNAVLGIDARALVRAVEGEQVSP